MKASEAEHVKLFAQIPPIEKMDASLSTLSSCKYGYCVLSHHVPFRKCVIKIKC